MTQNVNICLCSLWKNLARKGLTSFSSCCRWSLNVIMLRRTSHCWTKPSSWCLTMSTWVNLWKLSGKLLKKWSLLTHCPVGDAAVISNLYFSNLLYRQNSSLGTCCEVALRWMLHQTPDQSTLVQVMTWGHLATSHYLNQCWPKSLSPYSVTRPQWVNLAAMLEYHWRYSIILCKSWLLIKMECM